MTAALTTAIEMARGIGTSLISADVPSTNERWRLGKCGSTAAVAVLFREQRGGGSAASLLAAANVGDARAVLCRAGRALQLTTDHVPDSEAERLRIERLNPNPRLPLVRFVGGTWRVGGLLALSRAFGDSFMKGTG